MNQINLIGKVSESVITYEQTNGDLVAKFRVDIESKTNKSTAIDCIAWKKTAEIVKRNVHENDLVSISGKLTVRESKTLNAYSPLFEIVIDRVNLILPEHNITKIDQ